MGTSPPIAAQHERRLCFERAIRLYEQEQREGTPLLGQYIRRWLGWAWGGLDRKQKPRAEAGLRVLINDLRALRCFTEHPAKQA